MMMAVNPQQCVSYFSFTVPVYDQDCVARLVDRIRRNNQIPGMRDYCK